MRPRLSKALRDWLIELANITLGVLIALGLGEVVSEINWRQSVTGARDTLLFETGKNIGQGIARARATNCIERRLDTLAAIMDTAAGTGRLPPLGDIAAPPIWAWPTTAWDSVGSETRAHFGEYEMVTRANFALFSRLAAESNERESAAWSRLLTMVGPGRRVTLDEVAALRLALIEARLRNRALVALTRQIAVIASGGRFRYINSDLNRYAYRITPASAICQPIQQPPPAHYGMIG